MDKSAAFRLISRTIGLILLNIVYFGLLNPLSSRSAVVFGGFAVLALDLFAIFYLALRASQLIFLRPKRSAKRLAITITLISIVLLALQSVGQLSIRDTVAVFSVFVIVYFYSFYYRAANR